MWTLPWIPLSQQRTSSLQLRRLLARTPGDGASEVEGFEWPLGPNFEEKMLGGRLGQTHARWPGAHFFRILRFPACQPSEARKWPAELQKGRSVFWSKECRLSTRFKAAGITIRHSRGHLVSILQDPEMGWRGCTTWSPKSTKNSV